MGLLNVAVWNKGQECLMPRRSSLEAEFKSKFRFWTNCGWDFAANQKVHIVASSLVFSFRFADRKCVHGINGHLIRKYIYKVKIPLNNPKLVGFACLKVYINQIWAEQYLQNVFLCTFFPQRIFIIPLWKLEYVPFVMGRKIGGCEAVQTTPTPSALGRIAHYHTEVPLLAIPRQVDQINS